MTAPLWRLDNVTLPGRGRPRLDRLSVEIPRGVTAVVGNSGAGKTSLLNLLVGFEQPQAGTIASLLDGVGSSVADSSSSGVPLASRQCRADSTGKMPVAPENRSAADVESLPLYWCPPDEGLWPHLSVRRHLEFVAAVGDESIDEILDRFDLSELAGARAELLSAGERARLSAARAVATSARVLVMDEPFVHVNPSRAGRYWAAVREALAGGRRSLVFASHNPETVLREAAHVICLEEGRLIWQGPVAELYHRPPASDVAQFLGPINWFDEGDAAGWLDDANGEAICLRPEKLRITACDEGPHVVEQARFCGSVAEVELRDERTGARRRVFHRPPADTLRRGMRVTLHATLIAWLAVILAGCEDAADGKTLPVGAMHTMSLPAEEEFLPAPRAATFGPGGKLYLLDDVGRVLVYDAQWELIRRWRMPESSVGNPEGICVLRDGRICVADTHYHRVVFFDESGEFLGSFGEKGEEPGQFIFACGVAQDPDGNLYVSEYGGNDRVQKFTEDGELLLQFGGVGTGAGEFQRASGLAWHDGVLYVADAINNRVQAFREGGEFLRIVNSADDADLDYPYDVVVQEESLYVVEYKAGRVTRLSFEGEVLGRFGTTGRSEGQFWTPWGLAVDPQGRIVVADTGNRRIVELMP